MTDFAMALELDIAQQIEPAVLAYEQVIASDAAPLDAYLNLIFLYWESTHNGFASGHHLSLAYSFHAASRIPELLNSAAQRFDRALEMTFWRGYFKWRDWNEPLAVEDCLRIAEDSQGTTAAYLYVYTMTNDPLYLPQLRQLRNEAKRLRTTKNRYIGGLAANLLLLATGEGATPGENIPLIVNAAGEVIVDSAGELEFAKALLESVTAARRKPADSADGTE